jgi:hypothetical protein
LCIDPDQHDGFIRNIAVYVGTSEWDCTEKRKLEEYDPYDDVKNSPLGDPDVIIFVEPIGTI